MANVPNKTTFTLQDVYNSVSSHDATVQDDLVSCFDKSVASYFDSNYGSKTMDPKTLYGFRNYTPSSSFYGKRQMAVVFDGDIHISDDYGDSWTLQGHGGEWITCDISENGDFLLANLNGVGPIIKGSGTPITWVNELDIAGQDWDGVSMSYSGQYQIAVSTQATGSLGYMYGSTDYGATWSLLPSTQSYWGATAMSGNGQRTYVGSVTGKIFRFINYFGIIGASEIAAPANTSRIVSVCTTYDGSTVYIVTYENLGTNYSLYKSVDGGNTWAFQFDLAGGEAQICISKTGQYVMLKYTSGGNTGRIRNSSDYGVSWTNYETSQPSGNVAMDQTGQYRLVSGTGYLYKSSNFGVTWTQLTSAGSRNWRGVAI